jgi:sec-independent protein translocase protein TatB
MLDIGFPEFLLISFVLLIVVGPKDLPKVLRSITSFVKKIKSMASQFHSGIDDLANEAEISNLRKEVSQIDNKSAYSSELEEIKSLENELNVKSLKNDFNELNDLKSTKPKKKIKNK